MGVSLSLWLRPRIWLRIIGTAVQEKRKNFAWRSAMAGVRARFSRRARPSFLLEPLEQRRVMSVGGALALIDSSLPHDDLLARALVRGGDLDADQGAEE